MITPFKRPPCVSDIRNESHSYDTVCKSPNARSPLLYMHNGKGFSHIQSTCLKCAKTQCIPITRCAYFTTPDLDDDNRVPKMIGPLLHALVLSDCSNTVSAVRRGNPRTDGKMLPNYLLLYERFLRFLSVNYCNEVFNLSDTGTKRASAVQIWRAYLKTGNFKIGFSSRKECKNLASAGML